MQFPDISYATTTDGLRIAYQKWGDGPPLLICPQIISNVEVHNEHEYYRRAREHVGRFFTCVEFDKRGIGLSDRFDGEATTGQRVDDMLCVLDALGWNRAHFIGFSEGGMMGQILAADHPDRVETLTLVNTFVSPRYIPQVVAHFRPDDASALDAVGIRDRFVEVVETWGVDATPQIEWEAPSRADDAAFIRWMARVQRSAATASDFIRQLDSIMALDGGDACERITCPTLVEHVKGDRVLTVAMGRLLAELIPDAEYHEIDGEDHFSWVMPDWRPPIDRFIEFALGVRPDRAPERQFGTVVFTDIVGSTSRSQEMGDSRWRSVLDQHDRVTRRIVDGRGGRVVKSTGDGLLALFPMPSEAVASALDMRDELASIGIDIRGGVHAGEVEVHDDGDLSGITVNLAARVEQAADTGQVWVSSTVRDMVLGTATEFDERGEHALKGIDGDWRLFAAR